MERFPDALTVPVRFTGELADPLIAYLDRLAPDWVVNCAGATAAEPDLWLVNGLLPHRIRWPLIQPSTDHIDDDTEYARSKRLGETGHVIRCAIVDPDGGLLARARERDTEGETLRQWNGITAKAWADLAARIIEGKLGGLVVPGSPTITHYGLLELARNLFGWWGTVIQPVPGRAWRAPTPTLEMPPIETQLAAYL